MSIKTSSTRTEFIAHRLASRDEAGHYGDLHPAREVHVELARMLEIAQARLQRKTVPIGSAGYVTLFEIEDASTLTILALRPQLADDYR